MNRKDRYESIDSPCAEPSWHGDCSADDNGVSFESAVDSDKPTNHAARITHGRKAWLKASKFLPETDGVRARRMVGQGADIPTSDIRESLQLNCACVNVFVFPGIAQDKLSLDDR